ncbi:hypothetical protein WR25_11974 [Diploscapter pachys]|uniref:Uncharacterized protein n=1 Tax=Diploscapter pachys TaxID=2018661 RepID=A0A2A2KWQ5_9BILA|nr:hypothetical protein WR25_11974 [Diploscapter pachys]
MSTDGIAEKTHLLSPSPDEQQPGEVDGGQHYGQPIQPQGPTHVKWLNHYDNKYMCCCSNFHVKEGAIIFSVLYMLIASLNLINSTAVFIVYGLQLDVKSFDSVTLSVNTIAWVAELCSLACICILFVGIRTRKFNLFIPFFVLVGVHMLYTFVIIVVVLFQPTFALMCGFLSRIMHETMNDKNTQFMNLHAIMLIFFISALVIEVWVFNVVYRCLKYFSDMKKMSYCTPVNNV